MEAVLAVSSLDKPRNKKGKMTVTFPVCHCVVWRIWHERLIIYYCFVDEAALFMLYRVLRLLSSLLSCVRQR